ncbi:MAG TPA: hypothetical protein VFE50_15565 [Cyclobacteriaceae bacterium]|nr:hypothetical protein [Cyclobacteriaceae bacterium]
MLGLIFIYFVGKWFYDLAGKHDKNQWGFGLLGVVSYYAGIVFGWFIIAVVGEIVSPGFIDEMNSFTSLLAIPVGLATCWLTYQFLKRKWSKQPEPPRGSRAVLDTHMIDVNKNERYNKNER